MQIIELWKQARVYAGHCMLAQGEYENFTQNSLSQLKPRVVLLW